MSPLEQERETNQRGFSGRWRKIKKVQLKKSEKLPREKGVKRRDCNSDMDISLPN